MRKHIFSLTLLVLAVFFAYRGLPNSYFEQDEWHTFARFLEVKNQDTASVLKEAFLSGPLTHFTPLSFLAKFWLFNIFGLNASGYFTVSIAAHVLVSILLFAFLLRLTKNHYASFLGAAFFAVNSSQLQSVSWIGTFESTQGVALFGLIFLLLFKKRFLLSLVFLLVAFLFKETALTFLLFGTYLAILEIKKKEKGIEKIVGLAGVAFIYILLKFSYLVWGGTPYASSLGGSGVSFFKGFTYNAITLPFKALSQGLFPRQFFIDWSKILSLRFFQNSEVLNDIWLSNQFLIFDILGIGVGLILWLYLARTYKRKNIALGTMMFLASLVPLFVLNKPLVFFDSRFFYVVTIALSIILSALFATFNKFKKIVLTLPTFGLLVFHWYFIESGIDSLVKIGSLRKGIIQEIMIKTPKLLPKTIFYTESDSGHYGLKERVLPFQSGFGQTLLVNYVYKEEIPPGFLKEDYLWEIKDQGYRETEGRGFGYFRDFDSLTFAIERSPYPYSSLFSFRYNSEDGKLYDITDEMRGRLQGYFAEKRKVSGFRVNSPYNPDETFFVVDGVRKTFWDSKLPYEEPQFLQIDLGRPRKIAQIKVDSYNNKDQNEVGYDVSISSDANNWEQVFYSRKYPPNAEGFVDLYFRPSQARYVRLSQKGKHPYAPWVIHELTIYEQID